MFSILAETGILIHCRSFHVISSEALLLVEWGFIYFFLVDYKANLFHRELGQLHYLVIVMISSLFFVRFAKGISSQGDEIHLGPSVSLTKKIHQLWMPYYANPNQVTLILKLVSDTVLLKIMP